MTKFKIGDHVKVKATGEFGYIKAREATPIDGSEKINVEYIVKIGDGFKNWKAFTRKDLEIVPKEENKPNEIVKVYDVVDGYKITLYAKVIKNNDIFMPCKQLFIGYSIYSPSDEYDEKLGMKIARRRSKTSPFCQMESSFSGEFNKLTVINIMDAKADYIKNNFDKFINKRFEEKKDFELDHTLV